MKKFYVSILAISTLLFTSCNTNSTKKAELDNSFEVEVHEKGTAKLAKLDSEKGEDVVFYNMFSPVDLNKIIDQKSSYYNSVYVNSLNNLTKYTTSQKIALNTGIYGADLSYLWMFEQTQQALSYLSAIQHLTTKLGIPDTFVKSTFKLAEVHTDEMDSVIVIIRKAYSDTDKLLKETGRESSAVLILLGGWIETLNITLNMYHEPNSKRAGKIITQKYSLSSLITMVQNTQDDMVMSEYLLLLKKLQDAFNAIEVKLKPEDVEIDTVNKRITIKDSNSIIIQPEQFDQIKMITAKIRDHIIK
ncbi:MAG: hypothetical protein PF517_13225 [Salinivirgaceae bacterium]|jgi:hypothetical protein|nr:hypothetical protein [Salinivirgaceae bacterium]